MQKMLGLLVASLLCSGCGGYYILNVPDQVASEGGQVVPVARLQRNDFFVLAMDQPGAPMTFRVNGEGLKSGKTDELGYAAVQMDAPAETGRHTLNVAMSDMTGEEIKANVPLFVWDPERPVVAVDLDAVPGEGWPESQAAAQALTRLAREANIMYFTRNSSRTQQALHERFAREGFPDGPVLLWQRERWHISREGRFGIPRVVVEQRLVSQLPVLRAEFSNMTLGICSSEAAAQAFVDAGMRALVIGRPSLVGSNLLHRESWSDLARGALPSLVAPDAPTERPQQLP
jgi:hypothetical protein